MALAGKNALLKVMSELSSNVFTEEATTTSDNIIYTIDDRDLRYWDVTADIVVELDDSGGYVTVSPSEYLVQHCGGKIVFRTANSPGDSVRVSGRYEAVTNAAEINDYSYAINAELIDVSCFKEGTDPDQGFRIRIANLVDASGTISGFENVDELLKDYILDSKKVVLEFDVDTTKTDYLVDSGETFACYAVLESRELAAAIEGAINKAVSWQSSGNLLVEQK